MIKAIILSGNLVQDHEFIYPYYRLLEEGAKVDVCLLEGKPVEGILGTRIPPNKEQEVISIDDCSIENYNLLIIPGGAKAMEYLRQDKNILNFIASFNSVNKTIPSREPNGRYCKKPSRSLIKIISSIITTNKNNTATAPTYTIIKIIAKNSAPTNTKIPAALIKLKIRNKTEWTGFLALITIKADSTAIIENK